MIDQLLEYGFVGIQALCVGFVLSALAKTVSLHLIQIYLIKKHSLPMSGFKWKMFVPTFIGTFFKFMVNFNTNYVQCKLDGNRGGFEWRGVFSWRVW